jgi:hypothetical protein
MSHGIAANTILSVFRNRHGTHWLSLDGCPAIRQLPLNEQPFQLFVALVLSSLRSGYAGVRETASGFVLAE